MVKSVIKSVNSEDAPSGREAALLFANEQLQNNVSQLSGTVTRQERMIKMLQKANSVQTIHQLCLSFLASGLCSLKTENFEADISIPFCYLYFPGDKVDYKFNENRKNWAVQFTYPNIRLVSGKQFSFACGDEKIILPRCLVIGKDNFLQCQNKFDTLHTAYMAPAPRERILTQLCLLDIFKYYIEIVSKEVQTSPAVKLKQLIDAPGNMLFSITELSKKCTYSVDYMRRLFKKKYEISPQEYRTRHIMSHAMELICKSTLVITDISEECGFKYLSHFSLLFKKVHGMSPSEALKRFRYQ